MYVHIIVKIDAAAFSAVQCRAIYGLGDETQTVRSDRGLDPPDADPEPGTRCRRTRSEAGRLSATRLVRCAARIVARAVGRNASRGAGKADADPAIFDVPAD